MDPGKREDVGAMPVESFETSLWLVCSSEVRSF